MGTCHNVTEQHAVLQNSADMTISSQEVQLALSVTIIRCCDLFVATEHTAAGPLLLIPVSYMTVYQNATSIWVDCTLTYLVTLGVHNLIILKELPPDVKEV